MIAIAHPLFGAEEEAAVIFEFSGRDSLPRENASRPLSGASPSYAMYEKQLPFHLGRLHCISLCWHMISGVVTK